jgi:20S proteasome alpha/beta subunit
LDFVGVGVIMCRYQRLVFRHKLYQLREERDMKPETFASLVSAILYEKRFGFGFN